MTSWFKRGGSVDPANAAAAQGQPLLLIGFNESSQKWEVGQDALRVLRGIAAPVCTISVCGRARQGKSFLLNQMLSRLTGVDKLKGFVVSPTQQSCTRGIWMWSVPLQIPGPDGRKCNTLLMDCEGVDAVDQGAQHSAQIFSLAMLLSSIFIYNQVGAIDAIAIERLAMVCELAKRIKDRSTAGSSNGVASAAGQVDFMPAFIWLLRDFQLQLEADGKPITPGEYLERALLPIKGGAADIANKNQMRVTIKAVFPDRDVAVMVRPALTEADLRKLDTLPNNQLRAEFKADMDGFMTTVKSKARPMAVGGTLISGTLMAGLASAYVKAVNEGAVPQLVTAWQGVSRAECQRAFEAAAAEYNRAFQPAGVLEDAVLYERHSAAATGALRVFAQSAMGEPELVKEFEQRLRQSFEERYAEERRKLAASGERMATDMLAAEGVKLRGIMTGPGASVEAVEAELRRFLDEYDLRVPSGPFKYKKAAEFLMNTIITGIKGIVTDLVAAKERAAARAATADASVAQLQAEVSRLQDAEGRASTSQASLLSAQQEVARLKGQAEAKDRHAADLERQLGQLRQQQAAAGTEAQALQQQLSEAKAEMTRLTGQLSAAGRLQGEVEGLRAQLAAAAQREAALQGEKAAATQEAQQKAAQLAAAQQDAQHLQQQLTARQAELATARERVQALSQQLEQLQAAAAEGQVADSRLRGELEEERKKVSDKLQALSVLTKEKAELMAELVNERKAHDAAKEQLTALRGNITSPPAATPVAAAAAAGAGGRAAGGRSVKRRRTAAEADEDMPDAEPAPEPTPAPAEEPGPTPPAAAAAAAAGTTPGAINTDINPQSMTITQLKQWVTDNNQEDDEFFKLSQSSKTKKADWVNYVKKKLQGAGA